MERRPCQGAGSGKDIAVHHERSRLPILVLVARTAKGDTVPLLPRDFGL